MNGTPFEVDIRHDDPNDTGRHQVQFRQGWRRAVEGARYQEETLRRLTWNNLGYRLGKLFGPTSADHIDQMYEWCVRHQQHTGS